MSSATTRRTRRPSPALASSPARPSWRCTRSTSTTGVELLQEEQGLGKCNITKCCTEVCPEHIKITDNAIIPLKERVVDASYDPVAWLGRKILNRGSREFAGRWARRRAAGGRSARDPHFCGCDERDRERIGTR
jgi:hypothetical protein